MWKEAKDFARKNVQLRLEILGTYDKIPLNSGFSKFADTQRTCQATFSICVGYFLYSKVWIEFDVTDY